MNFSPIEVLNFVKENDVKFIRLTFCDVFGNLKNAAIMPGELPRAFEYGIPFDASGITGEYSDLLLVPDISTLSVLPWRPKSGRVVRFFCNIKNPDGTDYSGDLRKQLHNKILSLNTEGYSCEIATKCEFYLFNLDDDGEPTRIPHDHGGYLDVAPIDKCENTRREICLSLEEMGLNPKSSCHKHGWGQNEIDFRRSEPVNAADNMVHYKTVVKSIASQNGLYASFMPRPLENQPGSSLNICLGVRKNGEDIFGSDEKSMTSEGKYFIAGILNRIPEMTAFLNPTTNSYKRFGVGYAPKSVNWSFDNNSPLIRVPNAAGVSPRIEVRSADAGCNPYIAFNLLLSAGFEGIKNKEAFSGKSELPESLEKAYELAVRSDFIKYVLDEKILKTFLLNLENVCREYSQNTERQYDFETEKYFKFI